MKINERFDDNGKDYLPFSKDACVQPPEGGNLGTVPCFKAGDPRSSEVLPLASMHTLFLRLHNKFAKLGSQLIYTQCTVKLRPNFQKIAQLK